MQKFTTLTSIPAAMRMMNVDTDMIIPKQFLRTIKRTGLAEGLFYEMRFDEQGHKKPDFILHREPYTKSTILIAGENFGCGSSREHAPWALLDFGIRCIIAPSYSDIFFNNCFKNGILPIVLPQTQVEELMNRADEKLDIIIDLPNQKIMAGNSVYDFDVDAFRKHCLVNGLDDIGLTLEKENFITTYEDNRTKERPWV
jgi:3-isopropylmalate/(R)-2-methylmalate dehydratase small subunit